MVQPRPAFRYGAADDGAEGARLGCRPQVDVPDDHREEEAEGGVVQDVARLTEPLAGLRLRQPHYDAGEEEAQGAQPRRPEQHLLTAVVLAVFFLMVRRPPISPLFPYTTPFR